jgi:MYXO-CTERM domain-containing protein
MIARWIGISTMMVPLWLAASEASAACGQNADCSGGPARIMLVVDASSPTLNVGDAAGSEGLTAWDVIREVVAGEGDTLYDAPVEPSGPVASQVTHFGLAVFGGDTPDPGEAEILVDYAPCSEPRVEWSLDPQSSCLEPGCSNPWAGPPITWTFQDGSAIDPPGFAEPTRSHMPRCDGSGTVCEGSGRFVELAIDEVTSHRSTYADATPYVEDATTRYVNVLVITGPHDGTDDDVRIALEEAFDAGIVTYVLAYGELAAAPAPAFDDQLVAMADAGSGNAIGYLTATNGGELSNALRTVVADLELPCCATIDCSYVGGADSGAGDTDTDGADAGADWGGADGTAGEDAGSASASAGSDGSASASDTDTAGEIDDDGGCTCRSTATGPAWPWLLALVLLPRRHRRRS